MWENILVVFCIDRCRCTSSFVWPEISSLRPFTFPISTCWLVWAVTHSPPTTALTSWRSTEWGQVGTLIMGQLRHMKASQRILYTRLTVLMKMPWHDIACRYLYLEKKEQRLMVFVLNYWKIHASWILFNVQYVILLKQSFSINKCIVLVSEMLECPHLCSLYYRRSRKCRVLVPHLPVPEPVLYQPEARGPQQSGHAHICRSPGTSPPRDHPPGAGGTGLCSQTLSSGLRECKHCTCTWYIHVWCDFDDLEALFLNIDYMHFYMCMKQLYWVVKSNFLLNVN